jgi:hypothetical protein
MPDHHGMIAPRRTCCILVLIAAVTPPGFKTNTTEGTTVPCGDGEYRPEWMSFGQAAAQSCLSCGAGILSRDDGTIEVFNSVTNAATTNPQGVKGGTGACCECINSLRIELGPDAWSASGVDVAACASAAEASGTCIRHGIVVPPCMQL